MATTPGTPGSTTTPTTQPGQPGQPGQQGQYYWVVTALYEPTACLEVFTVCGGRRADALSKVAGHLTQVATANGYVWGEGETVHDSYTITVHGRGLLPIVHLPLVHL